MRSRLRRAVLLSALCLAGALSAQKAEPAPEALEPSVARLIEGLLAGEHPEREADRVWQAAAAAHGRAGPLIAFLRERGAVEAGDPGVSRLLIGVLRYEGLAHVALDVAESIPPEVRTAEDTLARAELLDTLGRSEEALEAYGELLREDLGDALRQRILFRRALMDSDGEASLEEYARHADRTAEERNQAAVVLALRDQPAAAIELVRVAGESTERYRQLLRVAEWALAAGELERAQDLAWEAAEVARLRRDRRYALTVVVSAYRAGDAVDVLLERFRAADVSGALDADARQVWIDLLRDEGRVDDALQLFQSSGERQWTPALRRQLLEICRETGREDVLIDAFIDLMAAEPDNLEWRSGLSRHWLESGDRGAAIAVWDDYGDVDTAPQRFLDAAFVLMDLGLDDEALRAARDAAESSRGEEGPDLTQQAWLFTVGLHLDRGQFAEAAEALAAIEASVESEAPVLAEVAGYYERMDRNDRAVEVLERIREARGGYLGTDLDMKFALLLSKVEREEEALEVWRSLWIRMRNTPRGRYVEDRLMTVASRLGVLARIAIELEDRLDAGEADTSDVELLVRLYVKVGDSAAATEITDAFLRDREQDDLEILRRKADIFLACQDYLEYETVIEELVRRDEEGRLDHLRELLLSRLERGRRAQAIEQLPAIRAASGDDASSDEFEAGIYQLAGLQERALEAYVKGLGRYPERIDTHLLVSNLMRETGAELQAARRFQYLAASAERDDLFTIAIDGLLNLRAQRGNQIPDDAVEWAMRVTLERLASRPDKFYLYRLAADLAEELGQMPLAIRTLTAGLAVAGERRTALLRELLGKLRSLDGNQRNVFGGRARMRFGADWDPAAYVQLGRRLLGQGEIVPPQVYMDLAAVFLHADAVPDAMRTFSRAAELLGRDEVYRQASEVLADAEHYDAALTFQRRLLAVEASDVTLLQKVGRLEELAGRDSAAMEAYLRGLESALRQTALRVHVDQEEEPEGFEARWMGQRNVDAVQKSRARFVQGLLVTLPEERADECLDLLRSRIERDLSAIAEAEGGAGELSDASAQRIETYPRLVAGSDALRRIAIGMRKLAVADAVDAELLRRFPEDRELAANILRHRSDRGFHVSAAELLAGTRFQSDPGLAWLAGGLSLDGGQVSPFAAAARVLPLLSSQPERLGELLESVDAGEVGEENLDLLQLLIGACALVDAEEAAERVARAGVRVAATSPPDAFEGPSAVPLVKLARRIDPVLGDSLTQNLVDSTAAQGARAFALMGWQLDQLGEVTVDPELSEKMLRDLVAESGSSPYGLLGMDLLRFVAEERRPALVRELYGAAPASVRLTLLVGGAAQIPDPVPDAFVEWFEITLGDALKKADEMQRSRARYSNYRGGTKPSLRLQRIRLEALLALKDEAEVRVELLGHLVELGELDAARQLFEAGLPGLLDPNTGRFGASRGRKGPDENHIRLVMERLAELGLTEFALEAVERALAATPRNEDLLVARWVLHSQGPGADAFITAALEAAPEERHLLERTWRLRKQRGEAVEALELLERIVADEVEQEGDEATLKRWKKRLAAAHADLHDPESEARVLAELEEEEPGGGASAAMVPAGVMIVIGPSSAGDEEVSEKVKEILAAEDPAEARRLLRKLWRAAEPDPRMLSFLGSRALVAASPEDLEALAASPVADAEARRMLRLLEDAGSLAGDAVAGALFRLTADESDPAGAARQLLADLESERGGTREAEQVLREIGAEGVSAELRAEVVTALVSRVDVPDGGRMRLMARELARLGRLAEAAQLYRLGVLAGVSDPYGRSGGPDEREAYLTEVEEELGEELGPATSLTLVEDSLALEGIPSMGRLALETWERLLSPAEAAERARLLHAELEDAVDSPFLYFGSGGNAARAAAFARVFGRAGEDDLALDAVGELVLAVPLDLTYGLFRRNTHRVPFEERLDELLAVDWERRAEWLRAVGQAVLDWSAEGRLADPAFALGAVGAALGEAGELELAAEFARALEPLAEDNTRALVSLARVERAAGDVERAAALEGQLLAARRLPVEDHARVVAELGEREGPKAAWAAGERATAYTADGELLEVLIALGEELGHTGRATAWREVLEARPVEEEEETDGADDSDSQG